jgi:hypothetical protein
MENAMSKRNWSDILQAQRDSGLSIEAFCRVQNLARSNFYAARARVQKSAPAAEPNKQAAPSGLLPIRVQKGGLPIVIATPEEIAVTVQFEARSLRLRGSATDLAQLLRCL